MCHRIQGISIDQLTCRPIRGGRGQRAALDAALRGARVHLQLLRQGALFVQGEHGLGGDWIAVMGSGLEDGLGPASAWMQQHSRLMDTVRCMYRSNRGGGARIVARPQ